MSRSTLVLSSLLGFLCTFMSVSVLAQDAQTVTTTTTTSADGTVIERREIITTAPVPKEIIAPPLGFASCFIVKAGWYQDVWVADRRVCTYSSAPEGIVWVEGYWMCNKYEAIEGICTNWEWKAAHWEKTITVY